MSFSPRTTSRLVLRPIVIDDWQAIHRYMSDPSVTTWLPEGMLDEAGAKAFAAMNAGKNPKALAMLLAESGELVGHMVFHPWVVPRTWEIGWVLGARHQRQGCATEAARCLLAYAFEALGCHRAVATCQPENVASWRVMEKLGMRREGHFRACIPRPTGDWWDEYFYALLAEEYFAARQPGATTSTSS